MPTKSITVNKSKKRKLTNKEKKENREVKAYLREQGVLPPVKKKLNRKKFAQEVREDFSFLNERIDLVYLRRAINLMLPLESEKSISLETVGVLKTVKLAAEIKRYEQKLKKQGFNSYNSNEFVNEVVVPIMKL